MFSKFIKSRNLLARSSDSKGASTPASGGKPPRAEASSGGMRAPAKREQVAGKKNDLYESVGPAKPDSSKKLGSWLPDKTKRSLRTLPQCGPPRKMQDIDQAKAAMQRYQTMEFDQLQYAHQFGFSNSNGLCHGFARTWMALKQYAPDASPAQIMAALTDPLNLVAASVHNEFLAACHIDVPPGVQGINSDYADVWFAESNILPANEPKKRESSFFFAPMLANSILESEGEKLLVIRANVGTDASNCNVNSFAHAVALHNPGGGKNIEFFDANHGLYSIPPNEVEQFLRALEDLYRNSALLDANTPNGEGQGAEKTRFQITNMFARIETVQTDTAAIPPDVKLRFDMHTASNPASRKALEAVATLVEATNQLDRIHLDVQTSQMSPLKNQDGSPASDTYSLLYRDVFEATAVLLCARQLKASKEALFELQSQLVANPGSPHAAEMQQTLQQATAVFEREAPHAVERLQKLVQPVLQKLATSEVLSRPEYIQGRLQTENSIKQETAEFMTLRNHG